MSTFNSKEENFSFRSLAKVIRTLMSASSKVAQNETI